MLPSCNRSHTDSYVKQPLESGQFSVQMPSPANDMSMNTTQLDNGVLSTVSLGAMWQAASDSHLQPPCIRMSVSWCCLAQSSVEQLRPQVECFNVFQ